MSDEARYNVLEDLVCITMRAFYKAEAVVVMDALIRAVRNPPHHIKDEELAKQCKLHHKQVRKLLTQLRDDQLVKSESRQEGRVNARVNENLYWYIDFKHVVEVVKFRLYKMKKLLEEDERREVQCQVYFCPKSGCGRQYTALDAIRLIHGDTLCCEVCGAELGKNDSSNKVSDIRSVQERMNKQLHPLHEAIRRTDGIKVPRTRTVEGRLGGLSTNAANFVSRERLGSRVEYAGFGATGHRGHTRPELELGGDFQVVVDFQGEARRGGEAGGGELENAKLKEQEEEQQRYKAWYAEYYKQLYAAQSQGQSAKTPTPSQHTAHTSPAPPELLPPSVDVSESEDRTPKRARVEEEEEEAVMVTVAGVAKRLVDVTEEDQQQMTKEEFEIFHDKYQQRLQEIEMEEWDDEDDAEEDGDEDNG